MDKYDQKYRSKNIEKHKIKSLLIKIYFYSKIQKFTQKN